MSKSRSEQLQDHHNKGQSDASEGKYDKPTSTAEDLLTGWGGDKTYSENDAAYDKGWKNAK